MLSFTGTVKILDFGIARAAEFAEEEAKKGLIKGKVSYLSPEQIYVRPFDARADIFALGVVFHEMLTGRRLFQSKNDITKMRELLAAPILPPSAFDAAIPRELDRIVMKSLEIDPKDRYQSAADMAADLERTLIAARYSSRELSNLLRDLYMAVDAEPVVVEEADPDQENLERTIAITSTDTMAPAELTYTRSSRPEHETQLLDGVVRAERSRLKRRRWGSRIKLLFAAVAIAALGGGLVFAGKRYLPALLRRPPPPPAPAMIKNQETPVPAPAPPAAPKPVKKKTTHKTKSHGAASSDEAKPPSGDAPLPPSTDN